MMLLCSCMHALAVLGLYAVSAQVTCMRSVLLLHFTVRQIKTFLYSLSLMSLGSPLYLANGLQGR